MLEEPNARKGFLELAAYGDTASWQARYMIRAMRGTSHERSADALPSSLAFADRIAVAETQP